MKLFGYILGITVLAIFIIAIAPLVMWSRPMQSKP